MYYEYKMCEKFLISEVPTVTDRNMNREHQIYIKRKCRLFLGKIIYINGKTIYVTEREGLIGYIVKQDYMTSFTE